MIYGADLGRRDSAGRTPEDVARDSGHVALAERLRTARYHVFDRLLQYLCSRKAGQGATALCGLSSLEELCLDSGECSEGRSKLEAVRLIDGFGFIRCLFVQDEPPAACWP